MLTFDFEISKRKSDICLLWVNIAATHPRENMPAAKYSKISLTEEIYFDQRNKYFNQEWKYNFTFISLAWSACMFKIAKKGKVWEMMFAEILFPVGCKIEQRSIRDDIPSQLFEIEIDIPSQLK